MTRIKICGITRSEDALEASRAGADALGFNFSAKSPRSVSPDRAREMVRILPPFVTPVGVFVEQTPEEVMQICGYAGITMAQLHGSRYDEKEAATVGGLRVLKVFRPEEGFGTETVAAFRERTGVTDFLFDTYRPGMEGGTGEAMEESLARWIFTTLPEGCHGVLAGGLRAENVAEAVRSLRPWAVDTASGVESAPGIKDPAMMRAFVREVRSADGM